ncbi:hypothetical protein [Marinilabilia salmonicolor]|uniref:hypothetical protein n=1 Tax=Marinilabilia salmonicolor TaxID=989 RepID=UPI00029A8022|nr:hypothetical protein [Marinilabilia salmonicolor]
MADESTYKGQVLSIAPEKEQFFENEESNLKGVELGLNGDAENLFPDDSRMCGICLGMGEVVPFISHSSKFSL